MAAPAQIGRYRIVGELGQGAMGTVYLGRDEGLDREVALKVMSKGMGEPEDRERFLREARAAARIQHPNIIVVYELGEHEGAPYMVLEKLEGVDLAEALASGLKPDPRGVVNVVLQALAGLGHAHENGIVHRDIKPANIFVPIGFPAKIMDFGVARLSGHSVTTTSGVVTGTPNYMSPEQFQGKEIDGRTDLFSTSLILFELVTGEKAFRSDDIAALFYKIVHEDVDLGLISGGSDWDRLRQVLARGLAKNKEERYPDARAMSEELSLALQDLGGSTDLTAPADRILLVKPRPQRPAPIATAAAAAPTAVAPAAPTSKARTAPQRPARRDSRRRGSAAGTASRTPMVLASALGVGAVALLAVAGWLVLAPSRTGAPASTPAPPDTAPVATRSPSAPPDPAPAAPEAPPAPETPATPQPTPPPTPEPTPPPTPAPAPTPALSMEDRLLRADDFLQKGRFRQALDEARAVRREDPSNQEAVVIAQEAEAAIVIEECIKNARAALESGDRDLAMEQIKRGFAINPNDARLMALFRQATQ